MKNTLEDFRKSIDNIDNALIFLLAERFHITDKVGEYKKEHNLPAQDKEREAAQFARIEKLALNAGLDALFAKQLLRLIIDEVIANHNEIAKK